MCCYTTDFEKPNQFHKMEFKKKPNKPCSSSQLRMIINEEAYTLSMAYLVFKNLYFKNLLVSKYNLFIIFTPL